MKKVDINTVVQVLADELDVELDIHTNIVQLDQWNSINALFVIARIEQDFHVRISIEDIRSLRSVKKLHAFIMSKQCDN